MANEFVARNGIIALNNSIVTGSLNVTERIVAQSVSSSFSGSGANLYDIPASGIVGLNLSQISSGSVSASISPNNGLQVNIGVTAPSFSGSFSGSGANLSGIPASGIVGLNLAQIATGSVTASVSPTQFSIVSASVTEFAVAGTGVTIGNAITDTHTVTGSFNISGSLNAPIITGSLFGTASWARNALTASVAVNGTTNDNFQQIFLLMGG